MAEHAEYQLRCELKGHSEDVRSVCVSGSSAVLTASRDKTILVWEEDGVGAYAQNSILAGHTDYVTSAAWMSNPSSQDNAQGWTAVSGSRDCSVVVWDMASGAPANVMKGHTYQVNNVAVDGAGRVVSASLDKTLRVWNPASAESSVLAGHEGPVLCCMFLPTGEILSGGGDHTVRRWLDGKCTSVIKAHSDSVRGLAEFPGIGFVTASHDQTLKIWADDGRCIAELVGHQAIVYSAAVVNSAVVVSGSEDNTCRIWRPDGTCLQVLQHPSCVWDVAGLPNGDIVTACGDHQAYIWTASPDRKAGEGAMSAYAARLPAATSGAPGASGGSALENSGLKIEPPEALMATGKPGQTKIIKEGNSGVAYTWDDAQMQWEKIGTVVEGPDDNDGNVAVPSKMHNGQAWDYVFDVDVADGMPPLKLAINRGDNPYQAADNFLMEYELPAEYKEQVVQFILQNTGGDVQMPVGTGSVDPYTGGNAYVPGGGSGGGSQGTMQTGAATRSSLVHCPLKVPLLWLSKLSNPEAVGTRVRDLNAALAPAAPEQPVACLLSDECAASGALDHLLLSASSFTAESVGKEDKFSGGDIALLRKLLTWPAACIYPALDIARLAALTSSGAAQLAADAGHVVISPGGALGNAVGRALVGADTSGASQQTCLRLLANCCSQAPTRAWLASQVPAVLDATAPLLTSSKPALKLAYVTLILNIAHLLSADNGVAGDRTELKTQALNCMVQILIDNQDPELIFRALVAVGTLLLGDPKLRQISSDLFVVDVIENVLKKATEAKARQAAEDVKAIINVGM